MTRRFKICLAIAVVLASLLFLLLAGYLTRGWIRATVVPAYVNHFYKGGISRRFDETYPPIKAQLQEAGLGFTQPLSSVKTWCQKFDSSEASLTYKGLRESISCDKFISTGNNIRLTNAFVSHWKQQAPSLDKYLTANGWRADQHFNSDHRSLATLFDHPAPAYSSDVIIAYDKTYGKTVCVLQLYFEGSYAQADYQCDRTVSFFGGYSYY